MIRRRAVIAAAPWSLLACGRKPDIPGGFNGMSLERGHLLRPGVDSTLPSASTRPQAATPVQQARVLIVGGGVAGLAAARALRQRGVEDFVLLELEDSAGGNARSASIKGLPCPMGAHYLPVPGDDAREVQDLLEELGLRRRIAGRWSYDERHLCHSPQERLFHDGQWQEGLLPLQGVPPASLLQYQAFGNAVEKSRRSARFTLPAARVPWNAEHAALDRETFAQWLGRNGLDDECLRWYLDYCCRDDYGADASTVSAWAGLHYFASRHGFRPPGEADATADPVLTWPEGNAWLTTRLAAPLGDRLKPAHTVTRIATRRQQVEVDAFDHRSGSLQRWRARQVIVALPLHVAARVIEDVPDPLRSLAASIAHAPWVVANIHLARPLADRPGAPPSWDNVLYGAAGLGYVDAGHQRLDPRPAPTVLTWYHAPGMQAGARKQLEQRPWSSWRDQVLAELSVPHPDLVDCATRIDVTRYGHAMAVPLPGLMGRLAAVRAQAGDGFTPSSGRLHFAHSDWSGYSVFEEAFTRGHLAGLKAAAA